MNYISVGIFANEADEEMIVCLEMLCEEIYVAPGLSLELLIEERPNVLPISINFLKNALQIYPHQDCPEWLIIFNGQRIKPDYPTVLSGYL